MSNSIMDKKQFEDNPFLALCSNPPIAQKTVTSIKESSVPNQQAIEKIIESVFLLNINKDKKVSDSEHGYCLIHMQDFIKTDVNEFKNYEILNQLVFDRIMLDEIYDSSILTTPSCSKDVKIYATETRKMYYMLHCYKRFKRLKKSNELSQDTINLCFEVISDNSVSLISEEMQQLLDNKTIKELYEILIDGDQGIVEYLDMIAKRIIQKKGERQMIESLKSLFALISNDLNALQITDNAIKAHLSYLTEVFTNSSSLTKAIIYSSTLNDQTMPLLDEKTILGQLFNFSSTYESDGRKRPIFFNNPSKITNQEAKIIEGNIAVTLDRLNSDAHHILYCGLKLSQDSKHELLTWIGYIIRRNYGRTKFVHQHLNLEHSTYVSDEFMLNFSSVLVRFCKPFVEGVKMKNVMKVDPTYMNATCQDVKNPSVDLPYLRNIPEQSCLLPKPEDIDTMETAKNYNFITECFFMTHLCYYSGFSVAYSKLIEYDRNIHNLHRIADHFTDRGSNADHITTKIDNTMEKFLSLKAFMATPEIYDNLMNLMIASSRWLVNVAIENTSLTFKEIKFPLSESLSKYLCYIPEFILENICNFISFCHRFNSSIFESHGSSLEHLVTLVLVFMGNSNAVRNPHIRVKLASLLECFLPQEEDQNTSFSYFHREKLFKAHPNVKEMMKALLNIFVSIEMTGQSVEFEEKFNYRRPMHQIFQYISKMDIHRSCMKELVVEAEENIESDNHPLFLRFLNLLINDAIFLLDEALAMMKQIKEKQLEMNQPNLNLSQSQRLRFEENFEHMAGQSRFFNMASQYTINSLKIITEEIKSIFVHPILADRISAMLNYFLFHLAGPKRSEFKVKDFDRFGFLPQKILSSICQIYLNLGFSGKSSDKKFCSAVVNDKRSYSPKLFEETVSVLTKIGKCDLSQQFEKFSKIVSKIHEDNMKEEEAMSNAPEEFLDPIMNTIMEDPVLLPTSGVIVDRSTILRHLLSDQIDPFNRKPLTMDMVKPDEDLREKIQEWCKISRRKD